MRRSRSSVLVDALRLFPAPVAPSARPEVPGVYLGRPTTKLAHHARERGHGAGRCRGQGRGVTPSTASIVALTDTPPWAVNPPRRPPAASTRWHGITIGYGLRPSA